MPRTRRTITESIEHLEALEAELKGTPTAPIITMLRLLREDPSRTLVDVAAMLRKSERTVRRWWKRYVESGVEGVIDGSEERVQSRHQNMASLAGDERTSANTNLVDHITREKGAPYTRAPYIQVHTPLPSAPIDQSVVSELLAPQKITRFINAIRFFDNPAESAGKLCTHLANLVDVTILLTLRTSAAFQDERSDDEKICLFHDATVRGVDHISLFTQNDVGDHIREVIQQIKERGYPLDSFHPPLAITIHSDAGHYLGLCLLWQPLERALISQELVEVFKEIGPFLSNLLSEFIVRANRTSMTEPFFTSYENLRRRANLTLQEARVTLLLLSGYQYKTIARLLNISIATVKKHTPRIYAKAGVESLGELFAKYFTMRLDGHHDTP